MSRYQMDDGTVVDTTNASKEWGEATDFDGRNHISRPTGDQWCHQTLFRSRKGRYYLEHWSQWQGSRPHVEFVSPEAAARWLVLNDEELPDDLKQYAEEITE